MIHTIFYNQRASCSDSSTHDHPSIPDQTEPIPIDAIIPLIEAEWKDEEYAYGEHYDNMHSKLSARAANLRRQLQKTTDAWRYQQAEKELADVESKLCEISLKFEKSASYLD